MRDQRQRPADRFALGTLLLVVFVDFLGYGVVVPVLPHYVEHFGAGEFAVGVLVALYALMQFLSAPLLGRVSDRYGRRPVLVTTVAGNAVAYLLLGLAGSLAWVFAARALSGVMAGNVAVAQAAVADRVPPDRRAAGFGYLGAAFGAGLVVGPALGGVLSDPATVEAVSRLIPSGGPRVTRFSLPAFLTALLLAGNALLATRLRSPATRDRSGAHRETRPAWSRLRENGLLAGVVTAYFLRSLAYSTVVSMFVLLAADRFGYGPTVSGYVLAFVGAVVALNQAVIVERAVERLSGLTVVGLGAVVESFCLGALPFTPLLARALPPGGAVPGLEATLLALLAVMGALATGDALTTVALQALASTATTAPQGETMGLVQGADGLARATGPLLAGTAYATLGYWVPFVASGVVMLSVVGLAWGLPSRTSTAVSGQSD